MSSPRSPDSVLPSPSPRSADGGRWRSTGRQRGSRGSCNKNKHISCLYSTTTGGHTHSSRSRPRSSRTGANQATMLQSPSLTMTLLTELGRWKIDLERLTTAPLRPRLSKQAEDWSHPCLPGQNLFPMATPSLCTLPCRDQRSHR